MEWARHREKIRTALPDLIMYTVIDSRFLSIFKAQNILTYHEVETIVSPKSRKHLYFDWLGRSDTISNWTVVERTNTERAVQFYDRMMNRDSYDVLIQALKDTEQHDIITILEEGRVPPTLNPDILTERLLSLDLLEPRLGRPKKKYNIKFNLIAPVGIFTGREYELEELHSKVLTSREKAAVINQTQYLSICGLGGIGKTQLTRQYIQLYSKDFDENVLWFTAEEESILSEAFKRLSKDYLQLSTRDADGADKAMSTIVSDVYKFFQGVKCLIVFDNADNSPWLTSYLPRGPEKPKPFVIITSRNREWGGDVEILNLSELKLEEAKKMVRKGLKMNAKEVSSDNEIEELCKLLQCFPLALGQAVSYISEKKLTSNYNILDYLEDYTKESRLSRHLLSFKGQNKEFQDDYSNSTYRTWTLAKNQIGQDKRFGKLAIKILEWMAYFNPDNISSSLFLQFTSISATYSSDGDGGDNKASKRGLRDSKFLRRLFLKKNQDRTSSLEMPISEELLIGSIRLLVRYSLINGHNNQSVLSIHRLVQQVIRMELEGDQREETVLSEAVPQIWKSIWVEEDCLDQCISLWRYAWRYDTLLQKYCSYLGHMVDIMESKGRYQELISFTSLALEHLQNLSLKITRDHGSIDDAVFWLRRRTGDTLARVGRHEEAKDLLERLVSGTRGTYGDRHRYTLDAMNSLAVVLNLIGETEEAIKITRFLLYSSTVGSGQLETIENSGALTLQRNLANNLTRVRNYSEAYELLQNINSSKSILQTIGDNLRTQQYLYVKGDLGDVLYKMGRYEESTAVLTNGVETLKLLRVYQDVQLATYLHRLLSKNLSLFGNFRNPDRDSLQLQFQFIKESLEMHQRILGQDHFRSLESSCYLGVVLRRMGNLEEALRLHKEAFQMRLETNGGNQRDSTVQLAKLCMAEDISEAARNQPQEQEEAFKIFEEVISTLEGMFGSRFYKVIDSEISYVRALIQHGNKEKAREILLQVKSKLNDEKTDRMTLVQELLIT